MMSEVGTEGEVVILVAMSETRSLADVKAHLSELVAHVEARHDRVTITVRGRPTAVLLAVDDLEGLEEAIDILSDGAMARALVLADEELAASKGANEASLREAMRGRRR
jgi:prevent-host-death family protein